MKVIIFLFSLLIFHCACDINCLDNNGKAVDWWVAYKLPKLSGNSNHFISDGKGYAYMDENSHRLEIFQKVISDESSFIGRTLDQVYKNSKDVGRLMWNDETPFGKTTTSRAHAKGVLLFNDKVGVFVRHSIPNFPNAGNSSYTYPASGAIYGQTLFCLSLNIDQVDQVAYQFLVNGPEIYDAVVPPSVTKFKNILDLSKGSFVDTQQSSKTITTRKGMSVTDYAKSKKADIDFWDSVVAPNLHSNLLVETWGRPLQPSRCSPNKIENIKVIKFSGDINFTDTKDHSKWCVTSSGAQVTCIGDINRMESQRHRGGGGSCFHDSNIYAQFSRLVSTSEKC
jgi:deoxyribonuclease-2